MSFSYSVIMGAALTTGYLLSRQSQANLGLAARDRLGILFGAFVGAMFCAKLPYIFGDWNALVSGIVWFQNGKTILCGIAGGYFGVVAAKWALGIKTRTGDSFVVPVAATIAVGRLACFDAQCCFGTPTDLPWGVVFHKVDALTRHPTQIYEALFHAMAALTLWRLQQRGALIPLLRGNLFKVYVIAYAGYRFFSEWIRPEPRVLWGLTGYQWGALALIVIFGWLWRVDAREQALDPNSIAGRVL